MLNKTEIYICIYNKQETQVHSFMFYAFGNHQVTSYTFLWNKIIEQKYYSSKIFKKQTLKPDFNP